MAIRVQVRRGPHRLAIDGRLFGGKIDKIQRIRNLRICEKAKNSQNSECTADTSHDVVGRIKSRNADFHAVQLEHYESSNGLTSVKRIQQKLEIKVNFIYLPTKNLQSLSSQTLI